MIYRFPTLEAAALFADEKKLGGHHAAILHLNSGHLYGSFPVYGFLVSVSELAGEEADEDPGEARVRWLPDPASAFFAVAFMVCGAVVGAVAALAVIGLVWGIAIALLQVPLETAFFLSLAIGFWVLYWKALIAFFAWRSREVDRNPQAFPCIACRLIALLLILILPFFAIG